MSEISVVVVGSTSINSVVGNGDSVNVNVGDQTVGGGNGQAATIQAGTVTTIDATQTATVTNVGSAYAAKFNFSLPRGYTGPTGPATSLSISEVSTGTTAAVSISGSAPSQSLSFVLQPGPTGPANSLSIGSVSTGTTAAVSITGTAPSQSLSFVLPQGPAGPVTSLKIGTVVTGSDAAATITGTAPTQTLNLVLPQGATGIQGPQGVQGDVGPANSLFVGSVTTTTATTASVSITGTAPSQQISFVIPQGPRGLQGDGGPYTTVQAGTVTTGAAGSAAKIDTVTSGGTVTLNFTIPRGVDGTANLADETPQPLGVASAGSASRAARADHVHATPTISYGNLTGVPSTFAPSAHSHSVSEVSGLQTALDGKQAAGNYATLVGGFVPSSQLPSFVDDVQEFANYTALSSATGESGKLYVTIDTRKLYRWSGTGYVEIASSPGSTDSVTEGSTNLYFTTKRAADAAPVQSVNGKTGAVTIEAGGIAWSSVPTATTTTTNAGALSYDSNYVYVANDVNQWRRTSIDDWTTPTITISVQPSSQTAVSGAATFSVTASASQNAELLYQWQRQAGGTGSWVNIATGLSATLALVDLSYAANNGDKYRVVITSGAAGTGGTAVNGWLPAVVVELTPTATLTSGEATLTISASISIITQPQNVSLTNGTSANFSVSATTPGSGLAYQWQSSPDGTNWTNINSATSTSYGLTGVTETGYNGYRYRCIVSSSGYSDATSNSATLVVAPITVTSHPASQTGAPVSGTTPAYTASFTSAASSPAGAPTLQWEVSTDGGTTYSDLSGQTASSLALTALTSSDSGKKYRAKFEKSGWNTVRSNAATLTVPTDVITVSQQPTNQTASMSSFSKGDFTLPTGTWNGVSNANGTWFATPNDTLGGDYIATSSDGVTWTKRVAALPYAGTWSPVVYGGGVYVTIKSGSGQAASSTDGINWTARTLPASVVPVAVVWNGSKFFAINASGPASASSSDGTTWSATTLISGYVWQGAVVSGSTVYAFGTSNGPTYNYYTRGQVVSKTSDNGTTWTPSVWTTGAIISGSFPYPESSGVIVDGTKVINYRYGLGTSDTDRVGLTAVSTDSGANFATFSTPFTFIAMARGSRYVAVTTSGIASSNDGINWVLRQSAAALNGRIAATSNGYIATIASSSNPTMLYTSTDGLTWTLRATSSGFSGIFDYLASLPIAVSGNRAVATTNTTGSLYDIGGVLSASFASAATTTFGSPAIQWQQSSDGGATWTDISGAVSSPLSFTPVSGDSGKRYRAVYSKASYSTVNSNSATLTVP
jgi:hypothetical protein